MKKWVVGVLGISSIFVLVIWKETSYAAPCHPGTPGAIGICATPTTQNSVPFWIDGNADLSPNSGLSIGSGTLLFNGSPVGTGSSTATTVNGSTGPITIQGAGSTTVSTVGGVITVSSPTSTPGAASGTLIYYVAAYNAPQYEKNIANLLCTGVDDGICLNQAVSVVSSTFPNGAATIKLSDGTFNVSTTVVSTNNFIGFDGDGPNNTIINMSAGDPYGFHFGNAQATTNDVTSFLSNMTVNGNSTSSVGAWFDGWGSGSYMNNVYFDSNVKDGYIVEDADRVSMNNVRASGGYQAACDYRVGATNTDGKILNTNGECGVTYSSSTGVLFDVDPDQGSYNPLDVIVFQNLHMQENSGISSGTCMMFDAGVRDLSIQGSQFEDCDTQINTGGNEVDGEIGPATSFINSLRNSAYILYANGYANLTFDTDEFQEATTAFWGNGVNLVFNGTSKNNGNITNLFGGSFGYRAGNDTAFAGAGNLVMGQYNAPYNQAYLQQVNYNNGTLNTQASTVQSPVGAANSVLEVDNGTQGQLGGFNAVSVNDFVYYPLGSGIDFGTFANDAYASSSQTITINIATSTSFSTPIVAGTNGKFMNFNCSPGVVLTYTGSNGTTAITLNDGTEFPKQAHESNGCSLKGTSFPSSSSPNGVYLGGSHGWRAGTLQGWSIWGFNIGLNWGNNSYNDSVNGTLLENNIENVNFVTYDNSGENDNMLEDTIVDPANNSSTNCIVLQQSAVSNLTIGYTSMDDCQLVINNYSVGITLDHDHFENPDYSVYGSAKYAVVIGQAETVSSYSNVFQQDAPVASTSWQAYYDVGSVGTLDDYGDVLEATNGYTIPDAIVGSGNWSLYGMKNYIYDPGATYAYASTTFQSVDTSQSGFGTILATTTVGQLTVGGTASTTATQCLHETGGVVSASGNDCGSGGGNTQLPGTLLTSTSTNVSTTATSYTSIATSTFTLTSTSSILVTVAGTLDDTGTGNTCQLSIFADGVNQDLYGNGLANSGGTLSNQLSAGIPLVIANMSSTAHTINLEAKNTGVSTPVCLPSISNFSTMVVGQATTTYPYTFAATSTATEVSATTTYTTVYSLSIPGNTLGLTHEMQFNFGGTYYQDVFSTYAPFSLELSYCNQTSSVTLSGTSGQVGSNQAWYGTAYLFNSSGTSQQVNGINIGGQKNSGSTGFVYASNAGITTCTSTQTQTFSILANAQSTSTNDNVWFQWANAVLY